MYSPGGSGKAEAEGEDLADGGWANHRQAALADATRGFGLAI
jgi:hypothetical protein